MTELRLEETWPEMAAMIAAGEAIPHTEEYDDYEEVFREDNEVWERVPVRKTYIWFEYTRRCQLESVRPWWKFW